MEPIKELEERVLTILKEDPTDQIGSDLSFGADDQLDTTSPAYNNNNALDSSNSMNLIEDEDKVKCINPAKEDEFGKEFIFSYWADDTRTTMLCMDEDGNPRPDGSPYEFDVSDVEKVEPDFTEDNNEDVEDDDETASYETAETEPTKNQSNEDPSNVLNDLTLKDPEDQKPKVHESLEINQSTESMEKTIGKQMTLENLTMSVLYNIQECDQNGTACPKAEEGCKNCDQEQKDEPKTPKPTKKAARQFVTKKKVQESFEEMKTRKLTEAKEKGFSV